MPRSSLRVLTGAVLFFAGLLVSHNLHLFRQPIYEGGDAAANSLLVLQAKRLTLLHGHYSRLSFYHPGPALLYLLAAAEGLLYDGLRVVPAPHNAHMLGQLLFNALLLGVVVTIIVRSRHSGLAGVVAALVFLLYFGRHPVLASHWFAHVFFVIYLAFQVAAASVASGRVTHLGWMALAGGLAVHGHVCFVLFVVPIGLYVLVCLWARGGFRFGALGSRERRAWVVFVALIGLFVLPIALHSVLHYPGEIRRYLWWAHQTREERTFAEIVTFMEQTLTDGSPLGWKLVLGVFTGALLALPWGQGPARRFGIQLGIVCLLTSGVMFYYTARGVDDLSATYIGIFFGSVLLLGWVQIGLGVAALLDRGRAWRTAALAGTLAACTWPALNGSFTNLYPGLPELPQLAEAVVDDPRWQSGPPILTLHHETWPETAGLLVQLERRGRRPWVLDPFYDLLFTDCCHLNGRSLPSPLWQLDMARADEPLDRGAHPLGAVGQASLRELDARSRPGLPIHVIVGEGGRHMAVKPESGWAGITGTDHLRSIGKRATLLLDPQGLAGGDVRLTVKAASLWADVRPAQHVAVEVNGERVGEMVFRSAKGERQSLLVPERLLRDCRLARFTFLFPDAWKPPKRAFLDPPEACSVLVFELELAPVSRRSARGPVPSKRRD
jgi:hypothetical protein